jgi:hypothetical protein
MNYKFRVSKSKRQSLNLKATSKNVIPGKTGIHKGLTLLNSRLCGCDKLQIIRGCLDINKTRVTPESLREWLKTILGDSFDIDEIFIVQKEV